MKIFVDTNVFLDIVLSRGDYADSLAIFKSVKNRVYEGVIADISLVNIAYISRKVDVDIRAYLSAIEQSFSVQGADNAIIQDALVLANDDIEDNMQYYIALYAECDCIVSNDKGFYRGDVEVLGSVAFVARYLK